MSGHYGPGGVEAAKTIYHNFTYSFRPCYLTIPEPLSFLVFILTIIPMIIVRIITLFQSNDKDDPPERPLIDLVKSSIHFRHGGWAMATTVQGYIALTPPGAQLGDKIGLFKGGKVPLILRNDGFSCQLIGECYVHGFIHGEAFREEECTPIMIS
jgi:hypothetical protein